MEVYAGREQQQAIGVYVQTESWAAPDSKLAICTGECLIEKKLNDNVIYVLA
jgi:hypothetical protein